MTHVQFSHVVAEKKFQKLLHTYQILKKSLNFNHTLCLLIAISGLTLVNFLRKDHAVYNVP